MIRNRHIFILLTILTSLASFFAGCNKQEKYESADGMIWNTTYHIIWQGDASLSDSIQQTLNIVGSTLSFFDENSLVSKVNSDSAVVVTPIFIKVYQAARRVNEETNGAFDPTLAPLIQAWGFGKGHECTTDTARIPELMKIVGIGKTHLEGDTLIKASKDITFNFSAIAKGYGCDVVGEMFERNGVENYLVEIGGEICAKGKSSRGGEWHVSVDRPTLQPGMPVHDSQVVLNITDCGVATSGNYRNFHEANGNRFGHTIDPTTGRPVATDVLSATVIASTAMDADAYATACMVLGSKKSLQLAEKLKLPVMLILNDSTISESSTFKKYIQ